MVYLAFLPHLLQITAFLYDFLFSFLFFILLLSGKHHESRSHKCSNTQYLAQCLVLLNKTLFRVSKLNPHDAGHVLSVLMYGCEQLMYTQRSGIMNCEMISNSVPSFESTYQESYLQSILKKCRIRIFNRVRLGHCHWLVLVMCKATSVSINFLINKMGGGEHM